MNYAPLSEKVVEPKKPIYSPLDNHRYETLNNDVKHQGQYSEVQETIHHFSDRKDVVQPTEASQDYPEYYYYEDDEDIAQRPNQAEEIVDNNQVTDSRLDVDYEYYDEDTEDNEGEDYDYVYYYYYDYIDPKNLQHEKLPKPSYQKTKTVQ